MKSLISPERAFITIGFFAMILLGAGCSAKSQEMAQKPEEGTAESVPQTTRRELTSEELIFLEVEHDLDADGEPERIVLSRESPNPASWQYGMDPGEYCAVLIYKRKNSEWKTVFDSRKYDIILEGDFFEDSEAIHFADNNGNGCTEMLLRQYAFASHPPALIMIEFSPSGYHEIFHRCIGGFNFQDINEDGRYELLGSVGAITGSGSGVGSGGVDVAFEYNGQRYEFSEELTRQIHEVRFREAQAEFSKNHDRQNLIFLLSICADLGKGQLGRDLIRENADLLGDDLDYIAHEFDCELEEDKRSLEEAMSE